MAPPNEAASPLTFVAFRRLFEAPIEVACSFDWALALVYLFLRHGRTTKNLRLY
jgi:hypothetical protein